MRLNKLTILALALSAYAAIPPTGALAAEPQEIEELIIYGIRLERESQGATGLDLSVYDTPQSLSILDAEMIEEFQLDTINNLLKMTTGVNVDSTETDRTYYNSRGFDITSMHVDGIGIPFGSLIVGDLDTSIYEKVEVVRGSNGLITGLGNPSGTVNYVRKRPTNEPEGNIRASLGRWNEQRIVADVSTPLTASGRWAARLVGAYQDKESWLNHYENDRRVFYGVIDGQIGDAVTLTVGYSSQENNSDGVLWGAAPFIYTDGSQADFDIATTTTMDWTYWNTLTNTAFAEISWQMRDNLQLINTVTHIDYEEESELFYVYWLTGLDADTGLGMWSYPGKFDEKRESLLWDTRLRGSFDAWGQQHDFNIGVSIADSDSQSQDSGALSGFVEMPAFPGWRGQEVPRPTWDDPYEAANGDMKLNRYFGSVRLGVTDQFKLLLGLSLVDYENEGVSWGVSTDSTEDGTSPYLGFTWEVVEDLNVYASYSDIYQPQYFLDEDLEPLGSAEGKSYEFGLKKRFAGNLLASVALFRTEQSNLQEFVGYGDGDGIDDTNYDDDFDYALYRGIDVESEGIEVELAGRVTETVSVQAGATYLRMEDPNGEDARTFIPRKTVKLLARWNPNAIDALSLGASLRWQDETHFDSPFGRIGQDSYALLGGFASYAFSNALRISLNVDNLTDEKYLNSVKFEQSYYGAPRSYRLSVDWRY